MKRKFLLSISISIVAALAISLGFTLIEQPQSGNLAYRLEWEWGRAVPNEDGQGWHVTNDLGYIVTLTQGYLAARNIELIPCIEDAGDYHYSRRFDQLYPQPAYAGHSQERDASASRTAYIEALDKPLPVDLGHSKKLNIRKRRGMA